MRITRQNTTGLVIDIQERLFPVMDEKENLLRNCQLLINGLIQLHVPLVVTQQYTRGLGDTIDELKSIIPDFNFIEKREFSCCDEPSVVEKLKSLETKKRIDLRHRISCVCFADCNRFKRKRL